MTKQVDKLLNIVFSDDAIWEQAITKGDEKNIRHHILEDFSNPNVRQELKEKIENYNYQISPPHEARIPKDDGSMRTVYVNKSSDRILLTVINNIFFIY